jgi:hypothetical protein
MADYDILTTLSVRNDLLPALERDKEATRELTDKVEELKSKLEALSSMRPLRGLAGGIDSLMQALTKLNGTKLVFRV